MGEKKTIYYSRTYRRLGGNTLGCVIQICFLTIPFLLAVLFHMGDLTRLMCKAVRYVFADVCPDIFVFTQTKRYKPYGDISFIAAETVYPDFNMCLCNLLVSAALAALIAAMPWRGKPMGIYLILNICIHLISSLWFLFGGDKFPYTLSQYSELYVLQEISMLLISTVMLGAVTGIVGNGHFLIKLSVSAGYIIYALIFAAVRYIAVLYIMAKYSVIYMAAFYFSLGPLFDFVNMVFFSALFVNRMIRLFGTAAGREAWKWE